MVSPKSVFKSLVISIMKGIAIHIPKKKKLWIFGAWEGASYSDNSKYLFEYIYESHPEIEAIWITKKKEIVTELKKRGYMSCTKWSPKGIWYAFRAEAAFETEGDGDISSFMNGTVVIQLFHGLGIKAFRWVKEDGTPLYADEFLGPHRRSFWMATSEQYKKTLIHLLGIPEDHIFITGYPRDDALVKLKENKNIEEYRKKFNGKRMIIYMPTHRNFGKSGNKMLSIKELKKVDMLLENKDLVLFVKPHFHELDKLQNSNISFKNIVLANDKNIFEDVYSYVQFFDALITDYSTIAYEFACTGKPVLMFPYDLEEYKNSDSGLLSTYWEYPVGPMSYTWEETIKNALDLFEKDIWRERREQCRVLWHIYNDGHNCERVYETVKHILEGSNVS